jgi:hypothetical protein
MILTLAISLLVFGSAAIVVLLVKDEWFEDLRYPLGRIFFAMIGVGLVLLGISFFQRGWPMSAFFGTLFSILGVQIALWGLGISLDFLGNKPITGTDYRESLLHIEQPNRLPRLISGHLLAAIGILDYVTGDISQENSKELSKALRIEVERILEIMFDNSDELPPRAFEQLFGSFIKYSPIFRFEPPHIAAEKREVLEDLQQRLRYLGEY